MPFDPNRRLYLPDEEPQRRPGLDWLPPPITINTDSGDSNLGATLGQLAGSKLGGYLKQAPDAPPVQMPAVPLPTNTEPGLPAPNPVFGQSRDAMTEAAFRPRRRFPSTPY